MNARTTMTPEGQVIVPDDVREEFGLRPGEPLEWSRVGGTLTLRPVHQKSGRSFEEIEAEIRRIVRYDGSSVTIEQMNETIAQCWEEAALRSDR
jgi:AbrB family looped-hinge helix DNA binding protein